MRRRYVLIAMGVLALSLVAAGCGGGGGEPGQKGRGKINVGVRFPQGSLAPARVPTNAESVRISVLAAPRSSPAGTSVGCESCSAAPGTPLVPDTIINKPPGGGVAQATISDVPAGLAVVRAIAHPQRDGKGPALAEAQKQVNIRAGQTTDVALTLVEIVADVVATPPNLTMLVGEQAQIFAEARDATGAAIIGAALAYTSDDASVATVNSSGRVTAVALGSTTVRVRHTASGKEAQVLVTVVEARVVRVEVTADPTASVVGHAVQFTAIAIDDLGRQQANAQFDWRVAKAAMGTVDGNGRFVPVKKGVARVIARERTSGVEGIGQVIVSDWVVLLRWTQGADLDLHLFHKGTTEHAYFASPIIPVGELVSDSISAPGSESFAGTTARGRYPVAINYFRGQRRITGEASLLVSGKSPVVQNFTLTQANANGGYPVTTATGSWARPFDVVITRTGDVSAQAADTSIPLGSPGVSVK